MLCLQEEVESDVSSARLQQQQQQQQQQQSGGAEQGSVGDGALPSAQGALVEALRCVVLGGSLHRVHQVRCLGLRACQRASV